METALYGGRVDNTYDMRVLYSYLHQYFDDSVISGKTGYTQLSRKTGTGLPIGNMPVSYKLKVLVTEYMYTCTCTHALLTEYTCTVQCVVIIKIIMN